GWLPGAPGGGPVSGPATFVVPTPARGFRLLPGWRPDTIGVRVPLVTAVAADLLDRVGVVAATSANLHGGPDPARLDDVPAEILDVVAAFLDGDELPGTASTVVDVTGEAPPILRAGAVPTAEALARLSQ